MSIIQDLITDRTVSDVTRWQELHDKGWDGMTDEEKAEWNTDAMKGAYSYTDLNRVNSAVVYLAEEALSLLTGIQDYLESKGVATDIIFEPYAAGDVNVELPVIEGTRTTWERGDCPYPTQMAQYLANVEILRSLLDMPESTPAVPASMEKLTIDEANNIEKILSDVDTVRLDWEANAKGQIDYIGTYAYQLISGTFYAGKNRTLQHFSRGR